MEKSYEKKISSIFTISRVFALISIVSAHINFTNNTPFLISRIYDIISSIGVIVFLFLSGYYYNSKKYKTFFQLIKNKALTIGLPWLFFGTISYFYNILLSNKNFQIVGYLKWILGNGTYLYYLTVLFFCFLLFYRTNLSILITSIILSLISLFLTACNVWAPVIEILHITNYLNIFNWIGIFALGLLISQHITAKKLFCFFEKSRWAFLFLFSSIAVLLCIFYKIPVGYFSYIGIWLELLGALAIFSLSTFSFFENTLFVNLANFSFTIYLIHMIVIGIVDKIYNLHFAISIFATPIVIIVCFVGCLLVKHLIKLIKGEKWLYPLFGFRDKKL